MVNHSPKYQIKKSHILLLLGLLLIILSGARILWMESFRDQQADIKNGQFDLRDWNAEGGDTLLLDGEWEFYPSQWLMDGRRQQGVNEKGPSLIQVPGRWNEALHTDKSTPYGFASYRLRLYVDPEKDLNYSIRVPSVRTASELYVNGRLLAKSGQVGESEDEYIAKNLPYSSTFTADENGVIDIVIQAANYVDGRSSGIVRSIKFGSEEAIAKEIKVSVSTQLLAAMIFLIHSAYAFILFLLGDKKKNLLYFSLLTFCIALTSVLSNDEKLFHQLFYIGIEWDFRLTNFALVIGAYALLECMNHRELPYWSRVYPVYRVMNFGIAGITLFLDPDQVTMLFPVYFLVAGIAAVITLITILRKLIKDIKGNLLLLFSFLALLHHFIWSLIWRESGMSLVYYPFDLIISMGCLATVWFKGYFIMHANTKEIAATLQRMNDHKDQFLANTSHEFKNPLHSILNMSQSVLNRERHLLQERSIKELETVLSVGRRLTLILNDLIDVMSLQEGNPRLQKKAIWIQPIVTGVLDMLQFNADVKSVKIVNEIPEDFPPVHADENRVIQIVFNLLHNAVKYTNEGIVSIQAFAKDGRAFIEIHDTGIGMDEDMKKRLFHPYEQASTSETMIEGGFGLGLSISKQLVELHGGTFDVSSVLGEGSTFTFSLQWAHMEAEEGVAVSRSFEPSVVQPMPIQDKAESSWATKPTTLLEVNRDRPRLLIVDDDPVNLQVLEAILPPDEYEVTMVTSGKEALAILGTGEWDLVISDIMMPQMSGYELTRMIRERFTLTELPVLLLTARSQPKDIQSGFLAGANDYVTKPIEGMEIKSRIEALTTIKQSVREQLRLEAAWLQAQIQPHFLFNALSAVTALSDINLDKMRDLLYEFSNFLRNKFKFEDMDGLVPIETELSLVRSYLYIEKVRFEERLQVVWEIDDCEDVKIPFLTIQPLVENAIKHGVMNRIRGGEITIRISVQETHVEITVEDDGIGMDEDQIQRLLERKADSRSGVGLINTDQRLKRHFGTGLHIESTQGTGTKVTFHVRNKLNSKNLSEKYPDSLS
ncbi:two-component hybrid sensor and regulator [Brevibacillus brevis NBRC 100599]|uniref:histidine kinase n=1 Tax=Brevibacillus brevis (strain 47 / JCM 6285 / NBRC 100599) TaxID=358681 RepID=C0Z9X4_BREBN|nr:ATP-binding protein [Brevibacillus brevis]BAH46828.1 two-component hybrid sensor and regulator [Brevibacillus brevis NBRC 100599]